MGKEEAKARLHALNAAILTAVELIRAEKETLDAFFEERQRMDSIGVMLDPTLWMNPERRATEAILTPVYRAAGDLVRVYDGTAERGRAVLERAITDAGAE